MPEVAPDTHEVALTDEVCLRIGNPADYVILVTRPTVKVTKVEAFEDSDIGGFVAQSLLTLMDGNGDTSIVVLPRNAAIGSLSGAHTINDNDVIRIDQMVRIPRADNERCALATASAYAAWNLHTPQRRRRAQCGRHNQGLRIDIDRPRTGKTRSVSRVHSPINAFADNKHTFSSTPGEYTSGRHRPRCPTHRSRHSGHGLTPGPLVGIMIAGARLL